MPLLSLFGYVWEALAHTAAALPGGLLAHLVAGAIFLAAFGAGRSARVLARRSGAPTAESAAVTIGLGLVLLATLAFALGAVGRFGAAGVAVGAAVLQVPWLSAAVRRRIASGKAATVPRPARALRASGAAALAVAALVVFLGTLALYPPLGFDATLYHLPTAQALVETGRLAFLEDLRFPVFPQLTECLFAIALLFGDDRAARLVGLGFTLLTAAALYGWTRRRESETAGWWAAALWIGSPYVVLFGADAYVDTALSFFAVLAVSAVDRLRDAGGAGGGTTAGERIGTSAALAAGGFAGAAAAVKYLGLYWIAVVPLAVFAWGGRRRVRLAAWSLLAALAVAAPWYLRIHHHTGNPVFPYFPEVFGISEWVTPMDLVAPDGGAEPARLAWGEWVRSVALGVSGRWETWVGPHPFNPLLVALAPTLLLLFRRPRGALPALVLGLSYGVVTWHVVPEPRYLLPALAWACAAVAIGLARLGRGLPTRRRSVAVLVAVALAGPGLLYASYRMARQGPVPTTPAAREQFLATRRPGYGAIAYLNRTRGEDYTVYCLWGEELRYFARGRFVGEWVGPARFGRITAAAERGPEALVEELHALDADYLVVTRRHGGARRAAGRSWEVLPELYEDAGSRVYRVPVTATAP